MLADPYKRDFNLQKLPFDRSKFCIDKIQLLHCTRHHTRFLSPCYLETTLRINKKMLRAPVWKRLETHLLNFNLSLSYVGTRFWAVMERNTAREALLQEQLETKITSQVFLAYCTAYSPVMMSYPISVPELLISFCATRLVPYSSDYEQLQWTPSPFAELPHSQSNDLPS